MTTNIKHPFLKGILSALLLISLLATLSGCCDKGYIKRGNWSREAYSRINALISGNGSSSPSYNPSEKPYAVFDFDNTTAIGDVEVTLLVYQIENLRFKIEPENMFSVITGNIPDIDSVLTDLPGITSRMLAEDICKDYSVLYRDCISKGGKDPDAFRQREEYLDFRAKLYALSLYADNTFGYGVGCLWILRLFNGMTREEIISLAKESARYNIGLGQWQEDSWSSPASGKAGKVTVNIHRGLRITPEMKDLYRALRENGIDTYICSASMEEVVEAVASDPSFGLGIDTSFVYGIRVAPGPLGTSWLEYDPSRIQTYHEGKSEAILSYMAPSHGGKGPLLVAGDSGGDRQMLIDFDDTLLGLIIDKGKGGSLEDLKEEAAKPGSRFVLQPMSQKKMTFKRERRDN